MTLLTCPHCSQETALGRFCEACGEDLPAELVGAAEARDTGADAGGEGAQPVLHEDCGGHFVDGWCDTCGSKQPDARDHLEELLDAALAAVSDRGHRHHRNEDAFTVARSEDGVAYGVVCDGVSSTVSPEVASTHAAAAALDVLLAGGDLIAAHRAADDAARAVPYTPHPELDAPSATFSAFVLRPDGHLTVGTLGDCRAYLVHPDGTGESLSVDDSWAQAQVEAGTMSAEEARAHPNASVITRWLGRDSIDAWEPRLVEAAVGEEDLVVLCSDGVWNYAPEPNDIASVIKGTSDAGEAALALVDHALAGGGHDNATAVVARPSADAPTAPHEPAGTTIPEPSGAAPDAHTDQPTDPSEEPDA